jgi:hypothetical protein
VSGLPRRLESRSWPKAGVSSGQIAGEESPANGRCYKGFPFFALHLDTVLIHRGSRKRLCIGGSHHLKRVTSSTVLDGLQDEPGGCSAGLGFAHGDRRAPPTVATGDEPPMNPYEMHEDG